MRLPSLSILPVAELGEAQAVVPGSRVIASVGNEQNALLFSTLILTIPMLIMIVISVSE